MLAVVVRNPSFDDFKLQITNTAEEAALLSSSCPPSDQMPAKIASSKLRNESQITNLNFANLKLQITKKEGVRGKLVINGMKALSSSMKLLQRRKMRKKTQKKPTKLTSIKKKLRKGKECPRRSQRCFRRRKYDKS